MFLMPERMRTFSLWGIRNMKAVLLGGGGLLGLWQLQDHRLTVWMCLCVYLHAYCLCLYLLPCLCVSAHASALMALVPARAACFLALHTVAQHKPGRRLCSFNRGSSFSQNKHAAARQPTTPLNTAYWERDPVSLQPPGL